MKRKISNLMMLFSLTLVLSMILPASVLGQAGKTNFSGSWTFDASKSTVPEGGGGGQRMGGGGDFTAKQDGNVLTVDRTRTNQNGETTTTTMKYTLDGKESINTNPRGDSKSVATWSADGKALTIKTSRTFDMNGETRTMNSTEVYTLTSATTLSVVSTRPGQDGAEIKMTLVYNKK